MWLRGGTYRSEQGITISFSGAPGQPVTWRAAPGEHFELDGAIPEFVDTPGTAWEPVPCEVRSGHNLYRSTSTYPTFRYGGFIEIDGQWLPLATHDHNNGRAWISSDHHNWRHPEPYYMGPGICHVPDKDKPAQGRLYVRLDNSTPEAQCQRNVAQIAEPDPRKHALRISRGGHFGLRVEGSHHVFEDFTDIHNYFGGLWLQPVTDLTFRRVGGRVTFFGARLGGASHLLIEGPSFDGCMDPEKWWVSYVDVKSGHVPADHVRKCGFDYGTAHHVEVSGGYFHDFFDSALSEGACHVEVHDVEFRSWDDAWQMYGSLHHIDLHHNTYLGAGPSRDDTWTNLANPFPGTLWIHDNIIDTTRYRIFWYRLGHFDRDSRIPIPSDPTGIGWREPIPFSAHGLPSAGKRTIPWKLYHNTIVTGINGLPTLSYVGLGQFGTRTALVEAPHEVYNNIILVRNGRPLAQDTWVDTGAEIYDGNIYWGWSSHLFPSGYRSIWRYLNGSAGLRFNGETSSMANVDKLRDLASQDSRAYYPPGWESAGLSVDPKLSACYKPFNPIIASGAVNLTATRWPGTEYKPWRGAVQP